MDLPGELPEELLDVDPEHFVAERDALAKRLKAEGRVAEAAGVKKLRKPTVAQWATAQVARREPDAVAGVRAASEAVAEAQTAAVGGGDRDALKAAMNARRESVRALGKAVDRVLKDLGRPANQRDEVLAAVDATITESVAQGTTFGLPDDVTLAPRAEPVPEPEPDPRIVEAEAALARADAELEEAEQALADARRRRDEARQDLAALKAP
jgi:hypothetical protein